MVKATMIKKYRQYSKADSYIIGYVYNGNIYMVAVAEIMPRWLKVEQASRNQGDNLRLRLSKAHKEQLMRKNPICLGTADMLNDSKYNKGETLEKLVTEYYGQEWHKDTVPYYIAGDITVDGKEIQIKLDSATLTNTKQLAKLQKTA